jgi:hypothetical protein
MDKRDLVTTNEKILMGYGLNPLPDKNSSIFLLDDEPIVFPPR